VREVTRVRQQQSRKPEKKRKHEENKLFFRVSVIVFMVFSGEDVANELVEWFNAVDLTYRADVQQARTELQQVRSDLLRWLFGFWATTLLTLAGLMVALRGP
jgi:hypothetical protein